MATPHVDVLGGPFAAALTSWMTDAACKDADRDLFFPGGDWYPGQKWLGADVDTVAKATCARCPVREECLSWALNTPEEHGYWAGTTPNDRDRLRRGISRKGCPLCGGPDLHQQSGRQVCLDCGMSWRLKTSATTAQVLTSADAA